MYAIEPGNQSTHTKCILHKYVKTRDHIDKDTNSPLIKRRISCDE